jgi:hypothetical protein
MRDYGVVPFASREDPVAAPCEHDNDASSSIKSVEFLDKLGTYGE